MLIRSGNYFGTMSRRREVGGVLLSEAVYSAGLWVPKHEHEYPFFSFCTQGEAGRFRNNEERKCKLIYHPGGEVHHEHQRRQAGRSFYVELGPTLQGRFKNFGAPVENLYFKSGISNLLAARLYQEFHEQDQSSNLAIEGLVLQILAEADRYRARGRTRTPRWLLRAHEIVHDEFANGLSLAEIANRVSIHPVYLAAEFRRVYGCTIGDYVRRLKVEKACDQLRVSKSSLARIAVELGFSHQAHFSRTFKSYTGITPSEFRKQSRT